jgi:hypothetical protein
MENVINLPTSTPQPIAPNHPTQTTATTASPPPANWNLFDAAVKLHVMAKDAAMEPLVEQITLSPKATPEAATSPHRLDLFDDAAQSKIPDRSLLMPFAQLVDELTSYEKQIGDPQIGCVMHLEQVTVDMPIELKVVVNHDGTVNVKGSPPTQLVKTTVMPVFHHMRLRVVRDDGK